MLRRHRRRSARRSTDAGEVPVSEIMGRPPVTVDANASLGDALQTFAFHGIRHLIVVDDAGRCAGMLTDRTVAARWVTHPMTFDRSVVADVCSPTPPVVSSDGTLVRAARIMRHDGVDAVVVIDSDRRPVGMVTTTDLIALIAKPKLPQA